jgi:hypothetical protein
MYAAAASAQLSIPGPDEMDQRPRVISDEQYREIREAAMRSREENAAVLPPGMDKAAGCAEYGRRLDDLTVLARAGGDARYMDHLAETRRRIQAAQLSAGCR